MQDDPTMVHGPRATIRQPRIDRKKLQALSGLHRIGQVHDQGVDRLLDVLVLVDEWIDEQNWRLGHRYPMALLIDEPAWPVCYQISRMRCARDVLCGIIGNYAQKPTARGNYESDRATTT